MAKRNSGLGPLLLLGLGAGLMYLFDPQQGQQRRAMLRDRAATLQSNAEHWWENNSEDILNRAQGLVSEASRIAQDMGLPVTPGGERANGKTDSSAS